MSRRNFIAAAAVLSSAPFVPRRALADEPDIAVIANRSSDVGCLSVHELYAFFTLSKRRWSNGKRVIPFNFPPKHSLRTRFDHAVLNMSPEEVAKYWIDQRIRGGNPPPKHVPSSSLMARVIPRLEGSIGYLPKRDVPSGVVVVAYVSGRKWVEAPGCE